MSTTPNRLLLDPQMRAIGWAMQADGVNVAAGIVPTFEEAYNLAVRAGIFEVLIDDGYRTHETREAALRYGWRLATREECLVIEEACHVRTRVA